MRWKGAALVLLIGTLAAAPAEGGHEWPIYSSFYPSVIRVMTVDAASAGRLLPRGGLQAFIGGEAAFDGSAPESVGTVDSLGAFVVVSLAQADCAKLWGTLHDIGVHPGKMIFHPFPVTPLHADYLEEADLARRALARARAAPPALIEGKVRIVEAESLVERALTRFDGWSGPPWIKSGWFQAYQLLADTLAPAQQQEAAAELGALEQGGFDDLDSRFNAERDFLSLLTSNCRRAVAGYMIRREAYDNDYYSGIQNIGFDSLAGLDSPVFIRTVKLKDYPWNGILRLGVPGPPKAAWNPVAGFTDPAGRLIWSALSDQPAFLSPYGSGFELDRMANVTPMR